jgi:hypothetical protein
MDARARLLRAALGFLSLEPRESELRLLHSCFDLQRLRHAVVRDGSV